METKSAPLLELKTNTTPGEFTAVISAIGNIDRQGDRVMPNAFKDAISLDPIPPVYWAHKHEIPPIGEGLDWREKGNTIEYDGRLFVKGEVEHEYANMVYVGMKSYGERIPALRQFSYTYGIPDGGAETVYEGGKAIRNLLSVRPVAEVGPCFIGANADTGLLVAAKTLDFAQLKAAAEAGVEVHEFDFFQLSKAVWDEAYVDALPDSAFLYVEADAKKDSTGKTEPRSARRFPCKDAQGQINMPRLREAIEEAPKAEGIDEKVRTRIAMSAKRLLHSQEGKSLLLGTIYSSKAWDDIEGYGVSQLLDMLDHATWYIQTEEDAPDVARMQGIAQEIIALLVSEFAEASADSSAPKALTMALEFYGKGIEASSEDLSTVSAEIARLLLAVPTH